MAPRILAPIMIGTYTRLPHLKKTISALQENALAQESELYIYSDAPKSGDEKLVHKIRQYIKSIKGFKKIYIVERKTNGRVKNNRGGVKELLAKFDKVIFLEDDNITSPNFLQFMNDALNQYKHTDNVLSICGYTPKFNLTDKQQKYDAIAIPRFIGWGVAFWKHQFELIPIITAEDYKKLMESPSAIEHINQYHGRDLLNRFRAESIGHIDGLDNKACFLQTQTNMFSIHPKHSLVQNIGNDGSGVHSSRNDKYEVQLWNKEGDFLLDKNIKLEKNIISQSAEFFSPDEQDMSSEILDNIFTQLKQKRITECSLWGIDILSTLFIELMPDTLKINYILDSWADKDTIFKGFNVITPQQAYEKGEKNIVIMSFASRFKMLAAGEDISESLNFTYYKE